MASPKAQLQKLQEALEALEADQKALKHKMEGVRLAIKILSEEDDDGEAEKNGRAPRGNVKAALFDLLKEVGSTGINANSAVEMGLKRGIEFDRGTVSSLLSRLKRDGAVEYDGDRYRLIEAMRSTEPST